MKEAKDRIAELLRRFVSGEERSLTLAGDLEVAIAAAFPEDEDWQDLLLALASYRPGGGPYLYDDVQILPKCKRALEALRKP